jgi:7-carboxy-7-deazaguanine synthase
MLKINEIFWSAQGEGMHSGVPAIFVRLAGCSLRCPYCDTRGAWARGRRMSAAAVAAAVDGLQAVYPRSRLVLTGGEPLEQDLGDLLAACGGRHIVAVETNGLHYQDLPIDWWTVSPKDVAAFHVQPQLWARASEIKLLATPVLNLALVKKMRGRSGAPIVLQPERYDRRRFRRTFALYRECAAAGLPDVRLGLQLHDVFRIP